MDVIGQVEVVRGYFEPSESQINAATPEGRRAEARRQLATAKAALDSTLSAVVMSCPDALDNAYVQAMAGLLMRAHKSAQAAALGATRLTK